MFLFYLSNYVRLRRRHEMIFWNISETAKAINFKI